MEKYSNLDTLLRSIFASDVSEIQYDSASGSGLSGVGSTPSLATIIHNDKTRQTDVFVKVCEHKSVPFMNNQMAHTMEKEIQFYKFVLPKMVEFQRKRGIEAGSSMDIMQLMPKYYGSGELGNGDIVLVLENIQKLGFHAIGTREFHSIEQVKRSFESIATFHATTFGMKVLDGFDFRKEVQNLVDYIHGEEHQEVYSKFHLECNKNYLGILKAICESKDHPLVTKNISRFCSEKFLDELLKLQPKIFQILRQCRSPVEPHGTLVHGDYHMWNVSFDDKDKIKMFDFQIICYASALTDLHYYLSQSTYPMMRKDSVKDFLKTYSESFLKVGRALGISESDLEHFQLTNIEKEYKIRSPFLYVFGLHYFTIRLIENREKFGTISKLESNEDILTTLDQCGKTTWSIMQHDLDLMNEIEELGTIDIMKQWI